MSQVNVIRAWKDEEYRNSLTEAERARLPENPAGLIETTEAELDNAVGGLVPFNSFYCTQGLACLINRPSFWFCPPVIPPFGW